MNTTKEEFVKFGIIGGASTIINYLVFVLLLYFFNLNFILASALGYLAGVAFGFFFNKKITFNSIGKTSNEAIKYLTVYTFSLFLGLSTLKIFVQSYSLSPEIANIIVISITTITNFFGSKFFAFKEIKLPEIFKNKFFVGILALKIFFAFFFASNYMTLGTIPFTDYFVSSGFSNPYQHFFELEQFKAFPYSTTMLFFVSFPAFIFSFLPEQIIQSLFIKVFLAKIPLLLADLGIFWILIKLLKTKEKEVILYYWASPIIFYISYFHGQLDAIPTFLLVLATYLLLTEKYLKSAIVLGLALGAKANIFIAIPLIFLYLWRNKQGANKIIQYFSLTILVNALLILPFIFSTGYQKLVVNAAEQSRIFLLQAPLGESGITLFIVPLVLILFFMRMAYFRKINQDALMMEFAIAFTILVTLVEPQPGWFFWAIPFLAYFFIKDKYISKKNYWLINIFFILHFIVFNKNSDIFQSFQLISKSFSETQNIYSTLNNMGINVDFISSIVFTIFVGIMIANIYFVYNFGLIANLRYKRTGLRIGIAGDSGSGKSHTNKIIEDLVGTKNLTALEGDDLHKWERTSEKWEKLTHLNPKSNFLQQEISNIIGIEESKKVTRKQYDHATGTFTKENIVWPTKFILLSGLHSFYLTKLRQMLDIKVFLDPDTTLKMHWKIRRDTHERGHLKEKILESIKSREKDYKKFLEPQKQFAQVIIGYSPKVKIKNIGDEKEKLETELNISVDNNFNSHDLLEQLENVETLNSGVEYNDDLRTQTMKFSGEIAPDNVARIAYALVPNLEEVLENRNPKWRQNLDGITQLILLIEISEKMQERIRGEEN